MIKKLNILAICSRKLPSAVIGVITPLEYMMKKKLIDFKFIESSKVLEEDLDESDIVICIRGAEEVELNIVKHCREMNKKVIYFLNDDLLNVHDSLYHYNKNFLNDNMIKYNIKTMISSSDYLWTTNQELANKYGVLCDKVFITNMPVTHFHNRKLVNKRDITIGFAGSIDHRTYFESLLYEPMKVILNRYDNNVKFEIFGFKPYYMHYFPIKYYDYEEDYSTYRKKLIALDWDIGISPLQDSDFHSCKYFNKFLEYGSIRLPGIYSNVAPYKNIVENKVNGLLVDNTTKDWVCGLIDLIENYRSRHRIATNAYRQLYKNFNVNTIGQHILTQFHKLL